LDPSFHAALQEAVGYLMTCDTRIEVMFVLVGVSRGGKGTIVFIIQ
jgi:phage/plasmid-associated DNA primase